MYKLVKKRRVRDVLRLIIYDSQSQLDDPLTQRIIAFHRRTKRYDCRVLSVTQSIASYGTSA
jgi:hypothetical protein